MNSGKINILGTNVDILNMPLFVEMINSWTKEAHKTRFVCITNVHGIMESYRSRPVRCAYETADACVPDGMPLTWIGHYYGHEDMGRVYGPDLILKLLELSAQKGFTNYFYGGAEGVAGLLRDKMCRRFPGLRVVGIHTPPFRPLTANEESIVIDEINRLAPDFLWIGIGAPKQELLMAAWKDKIKAKIMLGVGAAFDFHTGRVKQAPGWMQNAGLEWFYRFCQEPRRLWKRYLWTVPAFIFLVSLQLLRIKAFHTNDQQNTNE